MHIEYNDTTFGNKAAKYDYVLEVATAFLQNEKNQLANTANITALLKQAFGWFWIGFYWVDTPEELILGPFQGTLACTRITYGKGVCGTAWQQQKTQLVPNVHLFPGHIACSAESQSEIVVPIMSVDAQVLGVLDIDSTQLDDFDWVDQQYLERLCALIGLHISHSLNK